MASETLDFVKIITNLSDLTGYNMPIWMAVDAVCYFLAFTFALLGILQLRDAAEGHHKNGLKSPVFSFIAAVLLAAVPETITTVAASVYGDMASGGPLSTVAAANTESMRSMRAILQLVSLIGYMFFVRGIVVLKHAGEPDRHHGASVFKAVITMVAGMAAIYIDVSLRIVASFTGWNVSKYIG